MQRTILITGCSSGIGLAAAKDLHARGYQVIATCRREADVEHLKQQGLSALQLDVDNSESIARAVEQTLALTAGRLDAILHNAGYGLYGPLQSITRLQLEAQFSTNLFGIHELTRLLLPVLLAQGEGRIIVISSVLGRVATPRRGAYCASKYALEAWSDALRMELHDTGVKVSIIEPGPIQTQFTHNVQHAEQDRPVFNPNSTRHFMLQPEDVVLKICHALESRRPRLRYPVTKLTYLMVALKWLLPARWMDKFLLKR